MPLTINGLDELYNDMTAMAGAVGNESRVIDKALKAGAVPIEEQMKANASSDPKIISGDLYSSIRTHGVRQKRGGSGKQITIGVKHSEKGAYYSNPVEYGHGGPAPAPMHPFVRPAFDVRYPDACEEIKRVLRDALKP